MRRIDVFSRSEYPVHLGHGLRHVVDMLEHGRRKEDFAFASLSLWFLLLMALAGPPKEKPISVVHGIVHNGFGSSV
jgi:hypothetical protein